MENAEAIEEKLFKLMRLLARYNHKQERDAGGTRGQGRGQGRVLALLELKPNITQTELAFLLGIRNQSLGEMLSKMEKNGLISRESSSEDKRVQNIMLTDKGKQAANDAKKSSSDKIFDVLSEAEEKSFSDVLDKLIEGLEKEMGEDEYFDKGRPHFMHRPHMPRVPRMKIIKSHLHKGEGDIEIDLGESDFTDECDAPKIRIIKKHIKKNAAADEIDSDEEFDEDNIEIDLDGEFDEDSEMYEEGLVKIIDKRLSDGTGKVKKIIIKKDRE